MYMRDRKNKSELGLRQTGNSENNYQKLVINEDENVSEMIC